MSERPVFFDESGRRARWVALGFRVFLVVLVGAVAIFSFTLVATPVPGPLKLSGERARGRPLGDQVAHLGAGVRRELARVGLANAKYLAPTAASAARAQTMLAFYVPWDDGARASLARHIGQIDWLVPAFLTVGGAQHVLTGVADPQFATLVAQAPRKPAVMPLVQNMVDGQWDGAGAAQLLRHPDARRAFLDQLEAKLAAEQARGVVFDFESMPAAAIAAYPQLLAEARARFAPHNWLVAAAAPVGDDDWNLKAISAATDRVVLMDYDEHSDDGAPGPIASQSWFAARLAEALQAVGRDKAIVGIGNYGYDWQDGGAGQPVGIEDAWMTAHDAGATVRFDQASGNPTYGYVDGDGHAHRVWMLDAATAWNELRVAHTAGTAGIAVWRLGTEDAGLWPVLASYRSGTLPALARLRSELNVDVEGNGEILRVEDVPVEGHRTLAQAADGTIADERFDALPTPYVIRRYGYQPKTVALTFDDGPDPAYTPAILQILQAAHVPATFFVVGENAMAHPMLLRDILAAGSEIGNHSFTHPNLAHANATETRLELNSTQRLVEGYTGHAMRLFRAPYFGDAEPTTSDEILPALAAQQDGYLNVGLHADPNDWQRPGVDAIVARVVAAVTAGNSNYSQQVVLLHDGGGDRAQTVAALPRIIAELRARGYQFVPVSTLAGLSPAAVNPVVSGSDLNWVRADVAIFLTVAGLGWLLKWLFFVAIALGVARALILAGLALLGERRARRTALPPIDPHRFVSVLIPAFNEARVIEASVARVLASRDVSLEVIVVDDGSSDDTSAIVRRAFADEPRVQLLSLPNGGKARALNRALELARGDVVVALDADTQFEPETIARLARWFNDPAIGAVAGSAQVGNRRNLVTRWQAVEYVTAQNLERRALAQFGAITVVPGAVGAWRKAALEAVGGYPVDTLAEDQDLTIAIQRAGWRVTYDDDAVAWTEAPETLTALAKQRFRWAFGTLQCLVKHRAIWADGEPRGLARIGLPQAWLFQIAFALVSPLIDLALLASIAGTVLKVHQHGWGDTQSDVLRLITYWLAFSSIDALCGWVAYRLNPRRTRFPLGLLLAQRFVYRQLMYGVVVRATLTALRGWRVGWGKLDRTGRVGVMAAA